MIDSNINYNYKLVDKKYTKNRAKIFFYILVLYINCKNSYIASFL